MKLFKLFIAALLGVWLMSAVVVVTVTPTAAFANTGNDCKNGGTGPKCTGGVTTSGGVGGCVAGTATTGCVLINANVAPKCAFSTATAPIHLGELAGTNGSLLTSAVNGQSATLTGWCNGTTSTMAVQAFTLTGPASPPSGFTNLINYTATATATTDAGTVAATGVSTSASPGTAQTVGVFSSDIVVALSGAGSPAGLLVGGTYNGSVQVTLTPGL
jgi:hypothetical protein